MLEEPPDQGAHADSVGKARRAGPQGTQAPDDQVDLGPGLRCRVEGFDDFGVDQAVDLEDDPATARAGGFSPNHANDVRAQAYRRDQQTAESTLAAVTGQEVE